MHVIRCFPLKRRHHRPSRPRRPIFRHTAAYGHFGRNEPEFTWERTDKAEELRQAMGL